MHIYRLLIGLANGAVYEFTVADDMNSMWENRHWNVHANTVTAVLLSVQAELIFSCSKDRSLVWHCSETSVKFGILLFLLIYFFIFLGAGRREMPKICTRRFSSFLDFDQFSVLGTLG